MSVDAGKLEENTEAIKGSPVKGNPAGVPTKGTIGGPRPGGGRPKHSKNKETVEREEALRQFKEKVANNIGRIYAAQFTLATGTQMLFRIEIDEKGRESKPQMVSDQEEIQKYLAGDFAEDHAKYYFLATERPNNMAIDSLLDRTFGKAQQNVKMEGDKENPLMTILAQYGLDKDINPPRPKEDTGTDA